MESEENQGAGDLAYNQMCVPEATVENGRELALGVSQESGMDFKRNFFFFFSLV